MKVASLDVFIRDTMKEERQNYESTMDPILETAQGKTRDVFRLITRVWTCLQKVTSCDHEDKDESIQIFYLDLLLTQIQKTVLILAQALNTMTYHRRCNALSVIMGQNETKSVFKEKAEILGEKDFLLGRDFQNQVMKVTEAKTKIHNVVRRKRKGAEAQPQASRTLQMPYQENPSRQQGYRSSGGEHRTTNKLFVEKKGDRLNQKVSVITSPFLNSFKFPVLIPDSDLENVYPFIKNLFKGIKIPQVPLAGRLKYFLKFWEKLTRDPNILGIRQGFQIPFKHPLHPPPTPLPPLKKI